MATKRVILSEIKWDTYCDGVKYDDSELPTEMTLSVECDSDDQDVIHDEAMDAASDETGWCINSSLCKVVS